MDDSTQDPFGPLNELKKPQNVFTAVRELQAAGQAPGSAAALSLEEINTEDTGTLIVDELIAPAPDVEVTDPEDTAFYGAGMTGGGRTFGSLIMNFWAVAAGVLQVGFNNLGQLLAGAGAVILDVSGITIEADVAYGVGNSLKWKDTVPNLFAVLYGAYIPGVIQYFDMVLNGVAGRNSELRITSNGSGATYGRIILRALGSSGGDKNITIDSANGVTVNANLSADNLLTGTYTPGLTNVTNVASSTANVTSYYRVGNMVTVFGAVTIDPTATGATELGMALPIASAFANAFECGGSFGNQATAANIGVINADPTNDRARFLINTPDLASRSYVFNFSYRVI